MENASVDNPTGSQSDGSQSEGNFIRRPARTIMSNQLLHNLIRNKLEYGSEEDIIAFLHGMKSLVEHYSKEPPKKKPSWITLILTHKLSSLWLAANTVTMVYMLGYILYYFVL